MSTQTVAPKATSLAQMRAGTEVIVDAEGGVWTAIVNGGAVHRYSSEGVLEEVVELPVTKVTACAFGGEQPRAGALFRAGPQVVGQP